MPKGGRDAPAAERIPEGGTAAPATERIPAGARREIPVGEIPEGEIPEGEIPEGEIPVGAWRAPVGTLLYASVAAHEGRVRTRPVDDLESLAYMTAFLIR
jgi:hypothetical protein